MERTFSGVLSEYRMARDEIMIKALAECEALLKEKIRRRMRQSTRLKMFVFAMGTIFFVDENDATIFYKDEAARRQELYETDGRLPVKPGLYLRLFEECHNFQEEFGTMSWRIYRDDNGNLVEETEW